MNENLQKKRGWRGTLLAKEMRQNSAVLVGVFSTLLTVMLGLWLFGVFSDANSRVPLFGLFYWSLFALVLILGSTFLAEENGARTVNFLLRLPASRGEIFFTKIKSHVATLGIWCVIAIVLIAVWTVLARIEWGLPDTSRLHDLCTAVLWLPLAYFLAVSFSVFLDRSIAACLAASATAVGVYAATNYLGVRYVEWLHPYSTIDQRLTQIVSNFLLILVAAITASLSWWLFKRKEAR